MIDVLRRLHSCSHFLSIRVRVGVMYPTLLPSLLNRSAILAPRVVWHVSAAALPHPMGATKIVFALFSNSIILSIMALDAVWASVEFNILYNADIDMPYIVYTRLRPREVEHGGYLRLGDGYVLYSSLPRFKAVLEGEGRAVAMTVEGTPVDDLEGWLWEVRAAALEAALAESSPREDKLAELRRELRERRYLEIPADSREDVEIALALWRETRGCQVYYHTVSAKYIFRCPEIFPEKRKNRQGFPENFRKSPA